MYLLWFIVAELWIVLGVILEVKRRVTDKEDRFEPGTPLKFFIMTAIEGPLVWIGYALVPLAIYLYKVLKKWIKFLIAWMEASETRGHVWKYTEDEDWLLVREGNNNKEPKPNVTVPFMTWDQQREFLAECGLVILLLLMGLGGIFSLFIKVIFNSSIPIYIWWLLTKCSLAGLFGTSVFFIIYHNFWCPKSKIGLHSYIKVQTVKDDDQISLTGIKRAHILVCKKCGHILNEVERLNITSEKRDREKDRIEKAFQEKQRAKMIEKEKVTKIAKEAGVI